MAPKGYRIRMMEPGEAPALHALRGRVLMAAIDTATAPAISLSDFVTFLVTREIYVAEEKATGEIAGYAAAGGWIDLYWISEIMVDPDRPQASLEDALLVCVTERARWFHHRAIALRAPLDSQVDPPSHVRHGFMKVSRKDWTPSIEEMVAEEANALKTSLPRAIHVKWL
ncbi:GNAT family N-acetyltransferase [Jiella marina]|uniref:hypothetical protein n=1 Tax=Jiella sp. LLJ827 TaxID=2917712 RepID=UPI0021008F34|nr:hypothetical protein [Jiella sp. LLJ827]MCQ0989159.1 hypothetical protein [Jiella sp. LLJ827]